MVSTYVVLISDTWDDYEYVCRSKLVLKDDYHYDRRINLKLREHNHSIHRAKLEM